MAEENSSSSATTNAQQGKIKEESLERMEALLKQSALGVHVLFDNITIAEIMRKMGDEKDFFDLQKMKKVQDNMSELIAKKTYFEKISFLHDLKAQDTGSYAMLVRTYFHLVENNVRADSALNH